MTPLSPPRHRLRLVASSPRPRRLSVMISATHSRTPIGRTRPFRLSDSDLERLIAHAERLESQA
jgi:hypothetical protein